MSEAISYDRTPRDIKQELYQQLQAAPEERAEAMRDAFAVLQLLHDHGILELVKDAVVSAEKVVEMLTGVMENDQVVRTIRNLKVLAKMVRSAEPETLEKLIELCKRLQS